MYTPMPRLRCPICIVRVNLVAKSYLVCRHLKRNAVRTKTLVDLGWLIAQSDPVWQRVRQLSDFRDERLAAWKSSGLDVCAPHRSPHRYLKSGTQTCCKACMYAL